MPASSSPACSREPASTAWRREVNGSRFNRLHVLRRQSRAQVSAGILMQAKQLKHLATSSGKLSAYTGNHQPSRTGARKMLKPSFRLFIIPLGAICTLASLSSQNVTPRAQRGAGSTFVREQVVD